MNDILFSPIKLSELENLITKSVQAAIKSNPLLTDETDKKLLSVQEAANFLNLAVPTVYTMTSRNEIPFLKPPGTKRIYFKKKDLIAWLEDGRRLTNKEAIAQAGRHIKQREK